MSLRGYLFSLIGGLIILLTLIQLGVVFWIEANLNKEVDLKARHYSEQIIELAVEQFTDDGNTPNVVIQQKNPSSAHIKVEKLPEDSSIKIAKPKTQVQIYTFDEKHIIKFDEKSESETSSKAQEEDHEVQQERIDAETEHTMKISKKLLKKEFKTIVDKLHEQGINSRVKSIDDMQTFVVTSPNKHQQTWVSRETISPNSQSLFKKIQWMLVIVAVLGLLFAYWLSSQFNKPLKHLSVGFKRLAEGDYTSQVSPQGVKEIRTTINHYNQMVERLAELTKAEQQHKELAHLAELGEVSRGLAHALRNPIHTIGLSLEQLSDNDIDETHKQQLLTTVQQKITHLDKSIKALLALTSNGISREENIPVLAVVQDIILEYKSSVSKPINFDIQVDERLCLTGAESEIRSILHTLINNACDAAPDNGDVTICAKQTANSVEFNVIDNGSGLAPHIAEQLFQPHISSKPEGAGMGLYIAKRLITLHYNGKLSVSNNSNNGCTASATFGV